MYSHASTCHHGAPIMEQGKATRPRGRQARAAELEPARAGRSQPGGGPAAACSQQAREPVDRLLEALLAQLGHLDDVLEVLGRGVVGAVAQHTQQHLLGRVGGSWWRWGWGLGGGGL